MISTKVYTIPKISNVAGNCINSRFYFKQSQCTWSQLSSCLLIGNRREDNLKERHNLSCYKSVDKCSIQVTRNWATSCRYLSMSLEKDPDIFGNLHGERKEHMEIIIEDEDEEKYDEGESRLKEFDNSPLLLNLKRLRKPTINKYLNFVRDCINAGNLKLALVVFDVMKENRSKPTISIYNHIIRAYSLQGDIKQCFYLYNNMKKCAIEPNAATYTCLLNCCAHSKDTNMAMTYLKKLRQTFFEKQYVLNATNYNVMIKAYGWHNNVLEAFQVADEMVDKKVLIDEITYRTLIHTAISDTVTGLRYTLYIWHLMRINRIVPSTATYNLLLRAIRDTKLGTLKINDILIPGYESTKVQIGEEDRPNLLASPPHLCSTLMAIINLNERPKVTQRAPLRNNNPQYLTDCANLDHILERNRLVLFGGYMGILKEMEKDKATPDVKTLSLLISLVPNTQQENEILQYIKNNCSNIFLDIHFYNQLMKKRCMRHDYKGATELLNEIQRMNIQPNIMTFGVLALTCEHPNDAQQLLKSMDDLGYVPNPTIVGTLMRCATARRNIHYVSSLIDYAYKNKIWPNKQMYETLDNFEKELSQLSPREVKTCVDSSRFTVNYTHFKQKYTVWKQKMKLIN